MTRRSDLKYECLLCRERFSGGTVANPVEALVSLGQTRRYEQFNAVILHHCQDGGIGLARIIGTLPVVVADDRIVEA